MDFLSLAWSKTIGFLKLTGSYIIALLRHALLTGIVFFSGIQHILFTRVEICNVELKALPLRCDREDAFEKVAYIDKLCCEYPELLGLDENCNNGLDLGDNINNEDEGEE